MVTTYLHITYLLTNTLDTRDPIGSNNCIIFQLPFLFCFSTMHNWFYHECLPEVGKVITLSVDENTHCNLAPSYLPVGDCLCKFSSTFELLERLYNISLSQSLTHGRDLNHTDVASLKRTILLVTNRHQTIPIFSNFYQSQF